MQHVNVGAQQPARGTVSTAGSIPAPTIHDLSIFNPVTRPAGSGVFATKSTPLVCRLQPSGDTQHFSLKNAGYAHHCEFALTDMAHGVAPDTQRCPLLADARGTTYIEFSRFIHIRHMYCLPPTPLKTIFVLLQGIVLLQQSTAHPVAVAAAFGQMALIMNYFCMVRW